MTTIDGLEPRDTFSPTTIQELSECLAQAEREGNAITPVGGGTKLAWGNIPSRVDYVVRTEHFNRILDYEPADLTVSVESGCRFSTLQKVLREHGQFLPIDPPYSEQATIGGVVACNASGPLRFRYGPVRDMVIGMKVVHASGEVSKAGGRVVKNVSGYDLCKLYTGSYGTLGIIAEVNFKLQPMPESEKTGVVCFAALSEALEGVRKILNSQLTPSAMELVDPEALTVINRELRTELVGFALFLRFSGLSQAIRWEISEITDHLFTESRIVIFDDDTHQTAWNILVDFDKYVERGNKNRVVLKFSVPFHKMAEFFESTREMAKTLSYVTFNMAHVGNGIVYSYLTGDPMDERIKEKFVLALKQVRERTARSGGSAVVQAAPPPIKRVVDVWGFDRGELRLMKAIKEKLDPKHILNPGRFVDRI